MASVAVIGSGFAGLAAAACLAQDGHAVTVLEKNSQAGGRARQFKEQGFTFDMGPSWYWMPDVFEKYFQRFGHSSSDFYQLERLDPSYRVYFSKEDILDVPAGVEPLVHMFNRREPGSGERLRKFLEEARYKYEVGVNKLVYQPGLSVTELFDKELLTGIFKLRVFQSLASYVRSQFKDPGLIQLLEFPVLFLGATPGNTPALYSLMNYADMALGTWYPQGGMHKVVEALVRVAEEQGVRFEFNSEVTGFGVEGRSITSVFVNGSSRSFDYVVAGADYHHVEQSLLPAPYRRYTEAYWESRTLAPSSLIYYLGINKRLPSLLHHNLCFDEDFAVHAQEIYDQPAWPSKPLLYISCPSRTDSTVAPPGCENVFILIPVAPGLEDTEAVRDRYFDLALERLERLTGESIRENVVFKRSYAHRDFIEDYHAYKGNAYGLANTVMQTANLKPSIVNKKIDNLFYTGQLTVPGPGVPPSLISGQVVAKVLTERASQ
jgi:phytoene desaturase